MKYKYFLLQLLVITYVFIGPNHVALCLEQTPENLVREFYTWYLDGMNKMELPELNDEVYKYVYPCTVLRLRIEYETGSKDYNYFIDGNDYWPELSKYITVGKAIKINDTISIVPFGFGETKSRSTPNSIVFVQEEKGILYITKVEHIRE